MKINDAIFGAVFLLLGLGRRSCTSSRFPRSRASSTARRCFPAWSPRASCVCGAAADRSGRARDARATAVVRDRAMDALAAGTSSRSLAIVGGVAAYVLLADAVGFLIVAPILLVALVPRARRAAGPWRCVRGRRDGGDLVCVLQAAARAVALGRAQPWPSGPRDGRALAPPSAWSSPPDAVAHAARRRCSACSSAPCPGLTATMATALLVPVTFFMEPIPAIATIVTATAMAIFSGDIPGCLLRMPGTPASAAYTDEAYAMTRKGQAETRAGRRARVLGDRRPVRHRGADRLGARRWPRSRSSSARSNTSGWCCWGSPARS